MDEFSLQIDDTGANALFQTAKWARFIAIVGFVMLGLLVMVGLFAGSLLSLAGSQIGSGSAVPAATFSFLYIAMALLYFFPLLYLYRFGTKMKEALVNNNQEKLNDSLLNIKSCFKFLGIMTIVLLAVYALIFVGVIILGATKMVSH